MMEQWCRPLLAVIVILLLTTAAATALDVPPLRGRINDYAGIMNQDQVRSLESKLTQFEQQTGHQVAVLAIPTLEGEDIEGFSIRVAENWKLGQKGFDNGVILVVAIKDRRLRFEVGYGLEGVLPDATASRIIRDYIVPRFRAQDYAGGIIAGIDAVMKVIRNEPLPDAARNKGRNTGSEMNSLVMFLITLAVFGLMAFASSANRRRNSMWATHGRRHGPMIFGGFGGGGFRGGGFGGGGFSGGGGGFGGGGASSSW